MNRRRFLASQLALAGLVTGCLPDGRLKLPFMGFAPRALDDGWEISTPEAEGLARAPLEHAYSLVFDENGYVPARSFLVIKNGRLVAEAYCRDPRDLVQKRAIQSATKSFTSLLTGVALADGAISGPDELLYAILPEKFDGDPAKRAITLGMLLSMRADIDFSNEDYSAEILRGDVDDSLRYILQKPMLGPPDSRFFYTDADPQLVAGALQRRLGRSLRGYADERLFKPLGICDYVWEEHPDGVTYGAHSLYLRPRDMAKIGLLCLREGAWGGASILPASWIAEATARHSDIEGFDVEGFDYGYYFWRFPELGAYTANGHGGQYIFVIPDHDLVLVFTAEPDTNEGMPKGAVSPDDFVVLARLVVEAAGG